MKKLPADEPGQDLAKTLLDRVLDGFSYCVVPLAVLVLSVLVWLGDTGLPQQSDQTLAFHALVETPGEALDLAQARQRLARTPLIERFNTHRVEQPIWLLVPADGQDWFARFIDFPSRHAVRMKCWDAADLTVVGEVDRRQALGRMTAFRAGFAVHEAHAYSGLLCRSDYSGPAHIRATLWPEALFAPLSGTFEWARGVFEGGFIALALFTFLAAIINRESRYALLAVWLIGNLRLGAMSMGWDMQWLGRPVPLQWLYPMRQLTIAAYFIVTYSLFCQFFRSHLPHFGRGAKRILCGLCVLLLIAALTLTYRWFLPVMWLAAGAGGVILVIFLIRYALQVRSQQAIWYGAVLVVVLLASLVEVLAAAFDVNALLDVFNSVTAASAASLLAAFAFADQVRAERAERLHAQAELQRTYHVTPVGLFTLDREGKFLRANDAMIRMMARWQIKKDVLGQSWEACFGPASFAKLQGLAQQDAGGELELCLDGAGAQERVWYAIRVARADELLEGSLQDITKSKKITERLRFLANNDFLTGLYNRRGIEAHLDRCIDSVAHDESGPLALAYLDLDRFKLINDLYGHQIGDEVLKQLARRVSAVAQPHHILGRMGGDEFLLIMPEMSLDDARTQCRRIVQAIVGEHFRVRTHAFWVRVSVGLVEIAAGMRVKNAIMVADRACREAKAGKSDHLVVYPWQAAAFQQQAETLQFMQSMAESRLPKGLFLVMQPIMSLHSPRDGLDFEVLIRMRTDDGEVVCAKRILAAVEASGNVTRLDHWVLEQTLVWLRTHREQLARTRFVCLNLSGASLNDEAFMGEVVDTLAQYRDVAHLLCLEITEGVAVHDVENGRQFIERLRQFGSRVALDDFGAGYTSFLYLKELPADALKIDGSFIRTLNHHPANVAILESIVQLARNLGMRSIAEWVEDIDTLRTLAELGVDYVQGNLVCLPRMPSALLGQASVVDLITDAQVLALIDELALARSPRDAHDDHNGLMRDH